MRDVVVDPDCEMILWCSLDRLSNTAFTIAGVNSLDDSPYRPPTIRGIADGASGDRLGKSGHHILIERLPRCSGLLGPIEDGNRSRRERDGCEESRPKRPKQVNLHDPDARAALVQRIDRFACGLGARPHHHNHSFRIGSAEILEQAVLPSGQRGKAVHRLLNMRGSAA